MPSGLKYGEPLSGWPVGTKLMCIFTNVNRLTYKVGKVYVVQIVDFNKSWIYADEDTSLVSGIFAEWEVVDDTPFTESELGQWM